MTAAERCYLAREIAEERVADGADLWVGGSTAEPPTPSGDVWVTVQVRVDALDIERRSGGAR